MFERVTLVFGGYGCDAIEVADKQWLRGFWAEAAGETLDVRE